MTRRHFLLVFAVIAVVIGLRFALIPKTGESFIAEAPMPDGVHRVRLVAMTREGPLDYDWKPPRSGPFWRFFPWLRGDYVPFMPVHLDDRTPMDGQPGASFVFRVVNQLGRYQQKNVSLAFEDSKGFRYPAGFMDTPRLGFFGTSAYTTSELPRRDKTLRMLIWEQGKKDSSKPAVLEIANPFYIEPVSEWTPEPLPASKTVGDLKVELRRLIYAEGVHGFHPECSVTGPDGAFLALERQCLLEDATGNVGRHLSPFEPCWKVHFQISPDPRRVFSAEETCTREITFPPAGEMLNLTETATVAGVPLQLIAFSQGGCVRMVGDQVSAQPASPKANEGMTWSSGGSGGQNYKEFESLNPYFLCSYPLLEPGQSLIVRLRIGDELIPANLSRSTMTNREFSAAVFPKLPAEAKTAVLEVIVTKPEVVDFYVTPPEEFRQQAARKEQADPMAGG